MYSTNFIAKIRTEDYVKRVFLAFLLGAISVSACFGQNSNYNRNTADQSLRSSGRVNPASLGMEMDIPLGSYPGRGINLPLGLSYSSKLWRFQENRTEYLNNGNQNNYVFAKFSENSASGWSSSLQQPYIEYTGETFRFDGYGRPLQEYFGPGGESPPGDNYIRRIIAHLPGGGSQELRAEDAPIFVAPGQHPPASAWEGNFYATDGSALRYFQDSANGIYRLFMPDGSFYDFNAVRDIQGPAYIRRANRLTDINGNFVQFNNPTTQYPNGSWTDQMGRTFPVIVPRETPSIPTNQTVLEQTFAFPGLTSNAPLNYTLRWKKLKGNNAAESAFTNFNIQELAQYAVGANRLFTNWIRTDKCSFNYVNVESSQMSQYFNPVLLTEIVLPNGAKYRFSYNKYGEIEHIYYPTGGREEITYAEVASLAEMSAPYQQTNRGVTMRKIYESDADTTADVWTYSAQSSLNNYRTSTIAPDGTSTDRFMHRGVPPQPCNWQTPDESQRNYYGTRFGYDNILAGMAYEERSFSSTGQLKQRTLTRWTATDTGTELTLIPERYVQRNARILSTESIVYEGDAGLSTSATMEYDTDVDNFGSPQNVVKTKQYDYKVVSGGSTFTPAQEPPTDVVSLPDPTIGATLLKIAETSYLQSDASYNQAAYLANNLVKLPISTRIRKPNEQIVAQTEIKYDEANYRSGDYRGQPTSVRSWLDTNETWITVRSKYDIYGNVIELTDANNKTTTTEYSADYNYAYPTRVTTPAPDTSGAHGSTSGLQTTTFYNFTTGLPTSVTDANGQITTFEYVDALLRPTKTIAPNGHQTITEYGVFDANGQLPEAQRFVKIKTQIDETNWKQGYSWFDGLGRTIKSQSVDSSGDVFTETEYDNMSRAKRATNPYRTGDTKLWTETTFDTAGRMWKVTTPDNAVVETLYGLATTGANIGTVTTVKDQALKERRSITNALGQLTRVDEPNDSNQLGAINAPNQPTNYGYDILNNLTQVQQIGTTLQQCGGATSYCTQTRTFAYDSLSRLKTATNPESGTIQYAYDANGNLTTKTDARGITTTYGYDALNRVKTRTYSDSTFPVNYYYDNLTNAKGKLIKVVTGIVSSPFSVMDYQAFDTMGRVTQSRQTTDGTTYNPMTYTYNLSGALIEQMYPSGRVVKNTLNADGELSQVQSRKINDTFKNYANSFNYTAAGAVSSLRLGNGRWENTTFNSRLQPTQIGLGTSAGNQSLLKLNYDYGSTDNNGNVKSQTITVQRSNQSPLVLTQSYVYDSLNRLKSAEEKDAGNQTTWKQTFSFDRYGNRRFDQANTTVPTSFSSITNPNIDPINNRFTTGQGYTFDLAGNLLTDAEGRTFTYDAENKQKTATSGGVTVGQYFYDGDGKRVKKMTNTEIVIFVYDAAGKLVAEYSTAISNTPKIQYQTADHLGSPRINTDETGAIVSRSDYMPYGEEITGLGGRSSSDKYVTDDVRQGFTAYERDIEADLDFAQARYYNFKHGRFTSVDPLLTTGRPYNPKTWNRYAYTLNNPLVFIDPTGLYECSGTEKQCKKFEEGLQKANEQLAKIEKRYGKNSTEYTDAVRALKAYGTLGDENGVTVSFGKLGGNKLGDALGTMNKTGANTVNVTIDLDKNKKDSDLLVTIAHEGSHVADNQDYQSAMLAATSEEAANAIMSGPLRVTHGQSETKAFGISSVFAEFILGGGTGESAVSSAGGTTTFKFDLPPEKSITVGGESIWKSSWQKLDIETIRKNRSAAISKGLKKDPDYAPKLDKPIQ